MNKPALVHELKIHKEFADAVSVGAKTFEVRANDRGFQAGDFVRFQATDEYGMPISHQINSVEYQITYVVSGWGIGEGYVVFSVKKADFVPERTCRDVSGNPMRFECSECGGVSLEIAPRFCPNCGARAVSE